MSARRAVFIKIEVRREQTTLHTRRQQPHYHWGASVGGSHPIDRGSLAQDHQDASLRQSQNSRSRLSSISIWEGEGDTATRVSDPTFGRASGTGRKGICLERKYTFIMRINVEILLSLFCLHEGP